MINKAVRGAGCGMRRPPTPSRPDPFPPTRRNTSSVVPAASPAKVARQLHGSAAVAATLQLSPPSYRFPYRGQFCFADGVELSSADVIDLADDFVSPDRFARFREVARYRTFDLVPVLCGLYDMGNVASIARSADALGIGRLEVIDHLGGYKQSQRAASGGSDKWIHVGQHASSADLARTMKEAGYQLAVTALATEPHHPPSKTVKEMDWTVPTAVVFGNEKDGVDAELIELADVCVQVPMRGMVESFNVSVCAAIVLHEAQEARLAAGLGETLSRQDQETLVAAMCLRHRGSSVSHLDALIKRAPPEWQARRIRVWNEKTEAYLLAQREAAAKRKNLGEWLSEQAEHEQG